MAIIIHAVISKSEFFIKKCIYWAQEIIVDNILPQIFIAKSINMNPNVFLHEWRMLFVCLWIPWTSMLWCCVFLTSRKTLIF
jgi:hypothetical protein